MCYEVYPMAHGKPQIIQILILEFHERLAVDFPFVKREYLQKFVLMGAVAEKKE